MNRLFLTVASGVALLCAAFTTRASAANSVSLVASRSTLTNTQGVDWSQFGPAGTQLAQPFQITTDGGYGFTLLKNNSTTPFIRADQGNGFTGDFLPQESLLYSTSLTAFDFRFPIPIRAFGGQLQIDTGGPWTPYVRVFTVDGGDFAFQLNTDTNNLLADGSAPFVGVISTSSVISRVLLDSFGGGNTAVNRLTVVLPEPGSLSILAIATLIFSRRVRTVAKIERP